jgi:tetratricopeptide (TPR) repeat protein
LRGPGVGTYLPAFRGRVVPVRPHARATPIHRPRPLTFWKKLFGGDDPGRVDYYREGEALLQNGSFHEALTSFRLALKESPGDPAVLQQIAICYTRIGMVDEAAKTYRHVLQKNPSASGAHYGLAFILVRSGAAEEGAEHLEAFLADPPEGEGAQEFIRHARSTLAELRGEVREGSSEPPPHELF